VLCSFCPDCDRGKAWNMGDSRSMASLFLRLVLQMHEYHRLRYEAGEEIMDDEMK